MSGIAGLLPFGGEPVDPSCVRAMLDAMPQRGGDEMAVTRAGRALLGHRARWITDEARRERQPLRSRDGRTSLVYDGRVDNRDELVALLDVPRDATDGALLVELIARGGADALAECVGEFALAWWRDDGATVGLARDSLGMRPLYYAVTPRGLVWASELQALFVPGWIERRVNEGFIAEYLAMVPHTVEETPFAGVLRLPQAHALRAEDGRVARHQYWTPRVAGERFVSDEDAIEEFGARLRTAVHACRRATKPVAFQLSGGLDSSSVVAMAVAQGAQEPHTYSLVFPGDPAADESPYIDDAARWCRAKSNVMAPSTAGDPFRYASAHDDLPYHPVSEPLMGQLVSKAASDGHEVMLTGSGADQWLTLSLSRMAALLKQGRIVGFARFVQEARADYQSDWQWRLVLGAGILPLVPESIKSRMRPWVYRGRADGATWVDDGFARRMALDERQRASLARAPRVANPVVQESLVRLASGEEAVVRQDAERMGTHAGVEMRHPYYDRRLVEWLLTLPDDLRFRDGLSKYVSRRALADHLPASILDRRDKADFGEPTLAIAAAAINQTNWRALRTAERGWIDPAAVRALEQQFASAHAPVPTRLRAAFALWHVAAVERWLRAAFP